MDRSAALADHLVLSCPTFIDRRPRGSDPSLQDRSQLLDQLPVSLPPDPPPAGDHDLGFFKSIFPDRLPFHLQNLIGHVLRIKVCLQSKNPPDNLSFFG